MNLKTDLPGLVATVVLTGDVKHQFGLALSHLRSRCDREDWHKIEWAIFDAKLVEEGRDAVCAHAVRNNYRWLLMIDADAAPFPDTAIERMIDTMFVRFPALDVLGAYCQLKAPPFLPTIDTGSGTWEPHFPHQGLLTVIRTGAHFLMVKTDILTKFGPPWFRTRRAIRPAQAFAEVDNFARTKLAGQNPLTEHPEWNTLVAEARRMGGSDAGHVGEDSGFCDAVKAIQGNIVVDTDIVAGHVGTKIITPDDLKEWLDKETRAKHLTVGVTL